MNVWTKITYEWCEARQEFVINEAESTRHEYDGPMAECKGGKAPASDPAIAQAARDNVALGKEWLAYTKDQDALLAERQKGIDEMAMRVGEQQIDTQARANQWAMQDRARWEERFLPLQDKFIRQAEDWGSPEGQEAAAAEARADVIKSADMQKESRARDMARMGIDPRSGRYAGIETAADTDTALAAAGAENNARARVKKEGIALTGDAINIGQGLPAQAAAGLGLGLNAGTTAVGTNLATAGNARANTGVMTSGFQGATGVNQGAAGILNAQHQAETEAWAAKKQGQGAALAGIGQLVGTVGGAMIGKV